MDADAVTPRRRGRPVGTVEAVVIGDGLLKLHDFAFLRAVAEGIDPGKAARLYLLEGPEDSRAARTLANRLMGMAMGQLDGLAEVATARKMGAALAGTASDLPREAKLPSLEDFAKHYDPDMYSERELLELFETRYGAVHSIEQERRAKVDALNWLQPRLARIPKAGDATTLWFSATLCTAFRTGGALTLADCVIYINMHGRLWHRSFERLGRVRAARLVQWLIAHEAYLEVSVSRRVRSGLHLGDVDDPHALVVGGAVRFNAPASPVAQGLFRALGINTLGASSDAQAISSWLATLGKRSPHTLVAYRREVERLALWAARERNKALSNLDVNDAMAWLDFLTNPPAHWVCALPTARSDADWRPLRHALSARSAARALAAVNSLYSFLVAANYLVANPFAYLQPDRTSTCQVDVKRSFTNRDLRGIWDTVDTLSEGVKKRRLVAVLHLLLGSGLRREELVSLHWGRVKPLRIDGDDSAHFGLTVIGKGMRERLVPLRPQALVALRAHGADRQALVDAGVVQDIPEEDIPLIGTLQASHWNHGHATDGALSPSGLHTLLKQFFEVVAVQCGGIAGTSDFSKVSAHWMRHTFAHHALSASQNDLPVVQQLLGHASIATTGIYVKADVSQRLQAVLGMSGLVGPATA